MSDQNALTSKDGALWVFPDGPNHAPSYIGCTDADDISEPKGDVELIRCFGPDGKYLVVGSKTSPPDPVTTTLTSLTFKTRAYFERIKGEYGLLFTQREGGRADAFNNWVRALILAHVRNTERTYGGVLKREEDAETTRGYSITADPPVIEVVDVTGRRLTTAQAYKFNDIAMLPTDTGIYPVKYGVAVSDGQAAVKAFTYITSDGGLTWTKTAAEPFAVNEHLAACAILDMGNGARRLIVGQLGVAGATQGYTAYSDDDGATWTNVVVGTAAAHKGPTRGGGIFALDEHHVWLASYGGYIYFSADAGETWTAQESGVITATHYTQVKFTPDGIYGYAVAQAGATAKTVDGGTNWVATTAVFSTGDGLCLDVLDDDYVWVGDDDGTLWWTEDGGVTWTQRSGWIGSGAGDVKDIQFANDYVGWMLVDTAAPIGKVLRTIDGGWTWTIETADTNAGLNAIAVGDENYAVYCGLVVGGGTAFIGVLEE